MLKKLKKFRIDKNLKSKEMAEILEMSVANYSNMENGKSNPTIGTVFKFADEFPEVDNVLDLFKKCE